MLSELKTNCQIAQKKGLHFILASIVIWMLITIVQFLNISQLSKNFFTLCCACPLLPLAYLISKVIGVQFQEKDNPLTNLGIIFTLNQVIYLLIVMWVYPTVPDKMLMVYTMVFGAHLLPYGWLYESKAYYAFAVTIPLFALIAANTVGSAVLAIGMVFVELLFSLLLWMEVRRLPLKKSP
jgi:hypothetical protein